MRRVRVLPKARASTDFLVEELGDEVLVYDQQSHRAHCLSPEAAALWRICDGVRSFEEATTTLRGLPSGTTLEGLLSQLEQAGLVVSPKPRINRSRRALIGKAAVAAGVVLASPVIFSIVAPSVAKAASCGTKGLPCCANNTCDGQANSKNCVKAPGPRGSGRAGRLVSALGRIDRAEEAVGLVVRSSREEEPRTRTRSSVVSELEGPQTVDRERLVAVTTAELAPVSEVPVLLLFVGVDLTVAEVPDEQVAAEAAEARGSHGDTPWGVQLAVLRDARE